MRVLGLVPARAGSKRLRRKNTLVLGGLPLWRIAVAQARASHVIDEILITTDEPDIVGSVAAPGSFWRSHDGFYVLHRSARLCSDEATTFDVVRDAYVQALREIGNFDAVCILQPTSPLRTGEDIAACVSIMRDGGEGVESVVSVSEGPDDLAFALRHAGRIERLREIVIPNGAIYVLRTEALLRGQDWYGDFAYCYRMPRERALDINVQFDFETAERYLPRMKVKV